jgi:hypothetical protein
MTRHRATRIAALAAILLGTAAAGGAAAVKPSQSFVVQHNVQDLVVSGGSIAWAHAPGNAQFPPLGDQGTCGRVGLWIPRTKQRWSFRPTIERSCDDAASTGQGVWDVSVATRRLVWTEYMGGNFRDWWLVTATTTKRTPQRIQHVYDEADSTPPMVVGPGTPAGIPYAVNDRVVYLGEKGTALFDVEVAGTARAVAAGLGPRGIRVAVLLENGMIVALDARGRVVETIAAKGVVASIRVSGLGIAVQRGTMLRGGYGNPVTYPKVTIGTRVVRLPSGAAMLDVAQGGVLWTTSGWRRGARGGWKWRAGDLGVTVIATGKHARLVHSPSDQAVVLGSLGTNGLAWSTGRVLLWRSGIVPTR